MTSAHLRPCPGCSRHARLTEDACPFCGEQFDHVFRDAPRPLAPSPRLSRAALFALGSGAVGVAAGCSTIMASPAYGGPVLELDCGVEVDGPDAASGSCDAQSGGACGPASGGATAVALTSGLYFTCALLSEGTVRCWGRNGSGELGVGDCPPASPIALPVVGLTAVKALSAGPFHACALLNNGTVKCWGEVPSLVGTVDTPTTIAGLTDVVSVGCGNGVDTAWCSRTGTVQCWGWAGGGRTGQRHRTRGGACKRLGHLAGHGVEHQRCNADRPRQLLELRPLARRHGPLLGVERVRRTR